MNKLLKSLSLIAFLGLLTACGGHGYEGTYEAKSNTGLDDLFGNSEDRRLEIGTDYIEADGSRETFDEIFVRESAGKQYLVFKSEDGGSEEAWAIKDEDTLVQDAGFFKIELKRVD